MITIGRSWWERPERMRRLRREGYDLSVFYVSGKGLSWRSSGKKRREGLTALARLDRVLKAQSNVIHEHVSHGCGCVIRFTVAGWSGCHVEKESCWSVRISYLYF